MTLGLCSRVSDTFTFRFLLEQAGKVDLVWIIGKPWEAGKVSFCVEYRGTLGGGQIWFRYGM